MKTFLFILINILNVSIITSCTPEEGFYNQSEKFSPTPIGQPEGKWRYNLAYSDEFSSSELNPKIWDLNVNSWGAWNWNNENLKIDNGILNISMRYEPIMREGTQYYFTSGIIRSLAKITYGYFEAKIKACQLDKGACPAFWLIGDTNEGNIRNSEIDIVELLQDNDQSVIDMNLHCKVMIDDNEQYLRPNNNPELCKNQFKSSWNPQDDFHVYACENRPDSITWFIDGEKVAQKENLYWHLPMQVILSMGLRPPYMRFQDGNASIPVKPTNTDGFPTEMLIDYVRVWTKK